MKGNCEKKSFIGNLWTMKKFRKYGILRTHFTGIYMKNNHKSYSEIFSHYEKCRYNKLQTKLFKLNTN